MGYLLDLHGVGGACGSGDWIFGELSRRISSECSSAVGSEDTAAITVGWRPECAAPQCSTPASVPVLSPSNNLSACLKDSIYQSSPQGLKD